jgi:hypothetical protein
MRRHGRARGLRPERASESPSLRFSESTSLPASESTSIRVSQTPTPLASESPRATRYVRCGPRVTALLGGTPRRDSGRLGNRGAGPLSSLYIYVDVHVNAMSRRIYVCTRDRLVCTRDARGPPMPPPSWEGRAASSLGRPSQGPVSASLPGRAATREGRAPRMRRARVTALDRARVRVHSDECTQTA